ncbi:hemolysin D [Aureimonas endophytica]|uniref:Hemolysin D n=1 Tax=Aureimonas endophytica TaxID=2027858 RepID=A0A916ZBV8_9HYPH|nr:efflux RND transporter periplasmic adaptor subunit [Aureimonas endophytica]GGD86891.1 hemolysin D [Aureimonas endophytica]
MRPIALFLVCALAAGAYIERDVWLPYAPSVVANALGPAKSEASVAPAEKGGGKHGVGGGGGGGGGSRSVAVTTAPAEEGSLPITRRTIGYIRPLASTELAVETNGILREIDAKDGALVKAGDLIARLDDRAANANVAKDRAALARDQATLDNARSNLDRITRLVKSGATSPQAGDDAQATVKSAEATVGVDEAQLEADQVTLSKTEIRAPFDGRLGAFTLSVGALVQPGTSIVGIAQVAPVYAEFALPDTDLATVRKAMADKTLSVEVRPSLAPPGTPAETGPIVFIDNKIVEASASVTLRALLDNKDQALWSGQSIDVTIAAGEQNDIVVVPGVAVQPREKGSVAYVVGPDNKIEVRQVEVALRAGDKAGIANGLKAGERVVTEGQVDLVAGTPVRETAPADRQSADASADTAR